MLLAASARAAQPLAAGGLRRRTERGPGPQVRAAVRTLTLNVYSIADAAVQAFVVSQPASNYFNELAIFIAEQCEARAPRPPRSPRSLMCAEGGAGAPGGAKAMRLQRSPEQPEPCTACSGRARAGLSGRM